MIPNTQIAKLGYGGPDSSGLSTLYAVIAAYGILFGGPMLLVGLFVGWHILIAATCHVTLGVGFAAVAFGIARSSRLAHHVAVVLTAVVAIISAVAVVQAAVAWDTASMCFWTFMCVFFIAISSITFKRVRISMSYSGHCSQTDESHNKAVNPSGGSGGF